MTEPVVEQGRTGAATRRCFLSSLAGLPAAGLSGAGEAHGTMTNTPLTIYSPAPPTNPMHVLNQQLVRAAADFPGLSSIKLLAMALPESVNSIAGMPATARPTHLPIVTTVDFRLAREGAGPAWHNYWRANGDLKFVATLYAVGFGVQAANVDITEPGHLRGKRIGVPPRPSAVRLMTEALLRDGWGVLDDVTLVDLSPPQIAAALESGAIDATSWNLLTPSPAGFQPMLPDLWRSARGRYLAVSDDALDRINAANPFRLATSKAFPGELPLLSFAQALAAWDDTDTSQINALLACMEARGGQYAGLPDDVAAMAQWPDLRSTEVHPVALEFYTARGFKFHG